MFDTSDLIPGARYRHNRTGVVYELKSTTPGDGVRSAAAELEAGGKTFKIPAAVLDTLYTLVETAALPIGSVTIDAIDPEPTSPAETESEPELVFRRKGRPMNEPRPEFKSYFGEKRKDGPNPSHWKKRK